MRGQFSHQWSKEEDDMLLKIVENHQKRSGRRKPLYGILWSEVASKLNERFKHDRNGRNCSTRYENVMDPDLRKGSYFSDPLSQEEEQKLTRLRTDLGPRWSAIAKHLPGRSPSEIQKHWNRMNNNKNKNIVDQKEEEQKKEENHEDKITIVDLSQYPDMNTMLESWVEALDNKKEQEIEEYSMFEDKQLQHLLVGKQEFVELSEYFDIIDDD